MKPALLITIDTEGDDLWSRPREVTTRNAASLPRFQALVERFGFKPTWLVNWEMAHAPECREFLRDVIARGTGEVGMHLHAWDTPPLEPLTPDDAQNHPFLTEYPEPVMRAKIERLAGVLEETFRQPLRSHRAGRWAFDGRYARLLRERGFAADCSVCPGVDWSKTPGDPKKTGGPDYRMAPDQPYWIDEDDVTQAAKKAGPNALLEVPMTIARPAGTWTRGMVELFSKRHFWLRPNGRNGTGLCARVDEAVAQQHPHLMFMLHSSELMAGGSPTFRTAALIDRLYHDLEAFLIHARKQECRASTLGDFAAQWQSTHTN